MAVVEATQDEKPTRKKAVQVPYVVFQQHPDGNLELVGGVTARPGLSDEGKEKEAIKNAISLLRGDKTLEGVFLAFRGEMPRARSIILQEVTVESWGD